MGLLNLKGEQSQASAPPVNTNRTFTNPFRRPPAASASAEPAAIPTAQTKPQTLPLSPQGGPSSLPADKPPPYHDWTVIPDNSTLPPPPAVGHDESGTNNAERYEADRAHHWVKINPLIFPHEPAHAHKAMVQEGDISLVIPQEYTGQLSQLRPGVWNGSSKIKMTDACLLSSLPLYFAQADSPAHTGKNKTIYFEVTFKSTGRFTSNEESTLALGYCALPYPPWRLPGWERGSLAVHSDDGRRYVNNSWGGKDFSRPFRVGDTVGIGISFSLPDSPPDYEPESAPGARIKPKAEVFLTRDGEKDGSWDLHEELDHRDGPIDGLDGLFDLYAAVGIFGAVNFEVKFKRQDWLWRPR